VSVRELMVLVEVAQVAGVLAAGTVIDQNPEVTTIRTYAETGFWLPPDRPACLLAAG
jgi:hypothetical protein